MLYITRSIVNHGFIPFYWDNGGTGNYGMGLFNRSTGARAYPEVIKAIVDTSFTVEFPEFPKTSGIKSTINEAIKIYPNPVHNILRIDLGTDEADFCRIYDLNGRLKTDVSINKGFNELNTNALSAGLYFIKIITPQSIVVSKFIKD